MTVRWSRDAISHLREIRNCIAQNNPRAAARISDLILKRVQLLDQFPEMGRTGRIPETRELVIPGTPYMVPYSLIKGDVIIVAVIHGARRWP